MIRRLAPTVVASLAALVLLVVPAFAGSSFTAGAEAPADEDHTLELTITEPEGEDYGDTDRVVVVAPTSFAVVSCQDELTWDCTANPETGRVTFDSTVEVSVTNPDDTLQFTVHTPGTNGTYGFSVTQADGAEKPNSVSSAPTVTVTGGEDPQPAEDDGGSTDDGGTTSDDTTSGDTSTDSTDGGDSTNDTTTSDSGTTEDDGTTSTDNSSSTSSDSDQGSTSDSGGSTAPRRTEGRSNGTRLQITPGQPTTDPGVDDPDIADDPAIAPLSDSEQDTDSGTATMTAIAGQPDDDQDDAGGLPWQQVLGSALLVAGGAALAVRRWDLLSHLRDWNPMGRSRG